MTNDTTEQRMEQLWEMLEDAKREKSENMGADQNSCGTGYDSGYYDGLLAAVKIMEGSNDE